MDIWGPEIPVKHETKESSSMKTQIRRIVSMMLVLMMVVSMLPVSAFATESKAVVDEVYPNTENDGHTHNEVASEKIDALC